MIRVSLYPITTSYRTASGSDRMRALNFVLTQNGNWLYYISLVEFMIRSLPLAVP